MKQLCLAMGLLAYLGNANAFSSAQLASLETKSEPVKILKFNQQIPDGFVASVHPATRPSVDTQSSIAPRPSSGDSARSAFAWRLRDSRQKFSE